jgi:transcription elongation factor GreA
LEKPILLTKEGMARQERELEFLRTVKRDEMAERIAHARSFGDISENAEYDEAMNDQGLLEGRILTLENTLKRAVIIEERRKYQRVDAGAEVKIRDEFGDQTFIIVGPSEVDVPTGRISNESPMGKALLGHKVGESVEVVSPGGKRSVKILALS